jgi:hypothetical protein
MKPSTRIRIVLAGCLMVAAIAALIRYRTAPVAAVDAPGRLEQRTAEAPSLEPAARPAERSEARSEPAPGEPAHAAPAHAATAIRGTVLDDETGAPLERFEVIHSPAGAGRDRVDTMLGTEDSAPAPSEKFEGAHGRFEIAAGPEAESLCAFAEGYARSDPVDASAGAASEVVIRLRRAAVVRGRVVDPATGLPVENALVAWIDRSGESRTGPRERFERTDALGRFSFGSMPLSARRILAGREDLGEGLSPPLALAPGAAGPEIVIELPRSGS